MVDNRENQRKIQLALIVLTNAIPLAGVELWQWNAFQIIFLFWLESFIVGIYAALEINDLIDAGAIGSNSTTFLFCFFYFPGLIYYFYWISRILGGGNAGASFEVLRPFMFQTVLCAASFLYSHGLRYQVFSQRLEHAYLSGTKIFLSPFFRFFMVHTLLVTSALWIRHRHAALIYFGVTCVVKVAVDFGFHLWHEAHIPKVVKDREFFGL